MPGPIPQQQLLLMNVDDTWHMLVPVQQQITPEAGRTNLACFEFVRLVLQYYLHLLAAEMPLGCRMSTSLRWVQVTTDDTLHADSGVKSLMCAASCLTQQAELGALY